jgi:hypothetical protein
LKEAIKNNNIIQKRLIFSLKKIHTKTLNLVRLIIQRLEIEIDSMCVLLKKKDRQITWCKIYKPASPRKLSRGIRAALRTKCGTASGP